MKRRPIIGLSITAFVLSAIIGIASLPDEVLLESSTIENSQTLPEEIQSVPTMEEVSGFVSESEVEKKVEKTNAELNALKRELDQLKKEINRIKVVSDVPEEFSEISETTHEELENQSEGRVITSDEWIRIMREAHELGLPASATMMYGSVESIKDIAEHFEKIVKLQEQTHGFMAFIPWSFEPNNTLLQKENTISYGAGGTQLLKMIAISRLVLDGLIPHIQSSWLTNGVGMAQIALQYGADDFGGTLIGEEVVSCTGSRSTELTDKRIIESIKQIGYQVEERDNFYNAICMH